MKTHPLKWQKNSPDLPSHLAEWLLYSGSFMQRLRQHKVLCPAVQVLSQRWQFPEKDEKEQLKMHGRSYALIREVLIVSEGKHWMFARSVFPRETLTGKQQQLARLKNRSLGSVLFKDPKLKRSEFLLGHLPADMSWHAHIKQYTKIENQDIWGRRSVFTVQNKSLLLTEYFLPDIATL